MDRLRRATLPCGAAHPAHRTSPSLGRKVPFLAKSRAAASALAFAAFAGWAVAASGPVDPNGEKADLFALRDIRLLDGPLHAQQELNRAHLRKLDPDRLLSWFRKEAGLEPKAPPYRGWESEDPFLPGHILGFYMSGAAMTVQATGDDALRERLLSIVDQLEEVQRANGSGYALAVRDGRNVFKEIASGRIEITGLPWNGYKINGHFEPTYTLNKILLGLYQIILATESDKAKGVFLRLADWFGEGVVDKLDERQLQTLLQCEHGSLHESYVDAYRVSGNAKYLAWAGRLCHERMLAPLAGGDGGFLTNFHANSNIPKYTGFAHIYQITGEERLHRAALNAWHEIVGHRSWVIGGNSAGEHFFDPNAFDQALRNPAGPETCNSVNMLRLTEALFVTAPSARMMDFYERVLFNHILAAHDNERAMTAYYTPMFPGAYRVYGDEFDSMWCCTGTGLEVPGKYGRMIYTHSSDNRELQVNLFAASALDWRARQVKVTQSTRFPYEEATTLTIEAPEPGAEFALRIRHPAWVPEGQLAITVNGERMASKSGRGSYCDVRRAWRKGDVVHVRLPMRLGAESLPGCDRYVAFLYGPVVLAGELGRAGGLTKEDFWQIKDTVPRKLIPEDGVARIVAREGDDVTGLLRPVAGKPLHFRTRGFDRGEVSLVPFFENHFQRYAIYWQRITPERLALEHNQLQREAKAKAELDKRTVDRVVIGDELSEKEHGLAGLRTRSGAGAYGREMGSHWRHAEDGGWFSYRLQVANEAGPLVLRLTFWGREQGARKFDVLVDGETVATESLGDTGKSEFVHKEIAIPVKSLKGKDAITVRFQAHPGNHAGGLFDLRLLRP